MGDKTYSGDNVLIAVGGKPTMPDIPGIELAINSDGFFDLEAIPKKCAVVVRRRGANRGHSSLRLAG